MNEETEVVSSTPTFENPSNQASSVSALVVALAPMRGDPVPLCFARGETESAGTCLKTTTGFARALAQRTLLIAVLLPALTLATQSDDRVHSGRAPRGDVARQEYNDHEDHRHRDKHFRIKRSNSVEHT